MRKIVILIMFVGINLFLITHNLGDTHSSMRWTPYTSTTMTSARLCARSSLQLAPCCVETRWRSGQHLRPTCLRRPWKSMAKTSMTSDKILWVDLQGLYGFLLRPLLSTINLNPLYCFLCLLWFFGPPIFAQVKMIQKKRTKGKLLWLNTDRDSVVLMHTSCTAYAYNLEDIIIGSGPLIMLVN